MGRPGRFSPEVREQAIYARRGDALTGLVHHSVRGAQLGFKGSWRSLEAVEFATLAGGLVQHTAAARPDR